MEHAKTYKVILINDQPKFRKELKLHLENELGHNVIAETSNWKEFLKLPAIQKSDIIHIDIIMPGTDKMDAEKVITNYFIKRLSKYNGKHVCLKVR